MAGCELKLIVVTTLIFLLMSGAQLQTTFPHINLLGFTLHNNSYINVTDHYGQIACVTEPGTCSRNKEDGYAIAGAWFLPNGTKLDENTSKTFSAFEVSPNYTLCSLLLKFKDIYDPTLSGVFECASSETETGTRHQSVYVGVYNVHREVEVSFSGIDMINGSSPPFTLTFVSINLPPTIVEWRLDEVTLTTVTSTMELNDRLTTQYTHTLTVTERRGGNYKCNITSLPFNLTFEGGISDSATFKVHVAAPPAHVYVHQEDPATVHVTIVLHEVLDTVGYQISYTGPTSGSVAGDASELQDILITDLVNGGSYVISVTGKSVHLESEPVVALITLIPGAPELTLISSTADSVTFSWTVPSGTVVDSYELVWNISGSQPDTDSLSGTAGRTHGSRSIPARKSISPLLHSMSCACDLSTPDSSYTITGLNMYDSSSMEITVTAVNAGGSKRSTPLVIHLDSLQGKSNTSSNIGGIIGASFGSFFIGLVMGIVAAGVIVFKITQNYPKKPLPVHEAPPTANGHQLQQQESITDSDLTDNASYYPTALSRVAAQSAASSTQHPDDDVYDYIS